MQSEDKKSRSLYLPSHLFGSYTERVAHFFLAIIAFLTNFVILTRPSVSVGIIVVFYAISILQTITYIYVFNKYNYFFRINEILINRKYIIIKFRTGFTDCFTWDNVRYIDPFFQKIVFSSNSFIYLSGMPYLRDIKFIEKLNEISNGKMQLCIRNNLLGSQKLWQFWVKIWFMLKYEKPIYLRSLLFRRRN